jgi:hypothetical protein
MRRNKTLQRCCNFFTIKNVFSLFRAFSSTRGMAEQFQRVAFKFTPSGRGPEEAYRQAIRDFLSHLDRVWNGGKERAILNLEMVMEDGVLCLKGHASSEAVKDLKAAEHTMPGRANKVGKLGGSLDRNEMEDHFFNGVTLCFLDEEEKKYHVAMEAKVAAMEAEIASLKAKLAVKK